MQDDIQPFISPDRDLNSEAFKPVPKKNRILLENNLLAGDIILLWRIQFGTFTNETEMPKYFEFTYGIDATAHLKRLIEEGYCYVESPYDSLKHLNALKKKSILKDKKVHGLSKYKSRQLDELIKQTLTNEELSSYFNVRGIALTEKGRDTIASHPEVIKRHPQKKGPFIAKS